MIGPKIKKFVTPFLAWTAVAALCGIVALAQDNGAPRADGQIEMDVVHALDGATQLKNDLITAATVQGEVTLAGTVSSESSRQLAESIVKGVPGVTGVHDNLKVGNPNDDPNAQGAVADSSDDGSGAEQAQSAPAQNQQNQPYSPAESPDAQNSQAPTPQSAQGQTPDWGPAGPPPGYGQNGQQQEQPNQAPPQSPQGQAPDWGPAGPPPGYGQNQGQYSQAPAPGYGRQPYQPQNAPQGPRYAMARGPVTVPAGAVIQVRTAEALNSKHAVEGTPVVFTVISDVISNGYLAIPRGATLHGVVAEVKRAGQLTGTPELALQLTSLDLGGQSYPVEADLFRVRGPSKTGRTVGNAIGGAVLGAIIGGAAGGGGGAAIGAVAGGGAGTALSAASSGQGAWIPAEALVTFHLTAPMTVNPVSQEEASRLAQGLYQGGPTLYRRRGYGYPPPPGYYSPYYGPAYYGPVYYRPYYMVGGVYYWR